MSFGLNWSILDPQTHGDMMKWHMAVLVSFLVVQLSNLLGQDSINPMNKKIDCISVQFNSVKGQDKWVIEEVFEGKEGGYFVDLAAFDGIESNNTYALEKYFNWEGICIEPNPDYVRNLKAKRKSIIEPSCIDYANHKVDFRFDNGWTGGIVAHDTCNNPKNRGVDIEMAYVNRTIQRIPTKRLEEVLSVHKAPKQIDYLSLDIEGSETRALKHFPFDKYTFLAITVERPTEELNKILTSNGYHFIKSKLFCSFYLHESHPNLFSFEKEDFVPAPRKDW